MEHEFVAIRDEELPRPGSALFEHLIETYASETNKTASVWRAVPDAALDFRPHVKMNTVRTILVHQILSERRFFAEFLGLDEPPADQLLPPGPAPPVGAYVGRYVELARRRLPRLAAGDETWWLAPRPFFDGLQRQRIWTFWRRVLHTCHHRSQVQAWLRLAGHHVPAIYGPSGDETWASASPTNTVETAGRA